MSHNLLQPGVLSENASVQAATTSRSGDSSPAWQSLRVQKWALMFLNRGRFCDLAAEIQMMIVSELTAAELFNFRCCCARFNALFLANESDIVRGILKNGYYHTASALYGAIPACGPLGIKSLKDIARRCYIAELLAVSVAEHYGGQGFPTTIRMAKNIRPYLLAIGHFFEHYRTGLANYTYDTLFVPSYNKPGARAEREILEENYNEQTVQRICLTYKLLNEILNQKLSLSTRRLVPLIEMLGLDNVGMFTFGGLEMIKDIVTHTRLNDRLKYTFSHFCKTTTNPPRLINEESLPVALPPSVLGPRLSEVKTLKIWRQLYFSVPHPILDVCNIEVHGFSEVEPAEELDMNRDFLEYLKLYDGEEPKLVL